MQAIGDWRSRSIDVIIEDDRAAQLVEILGKTNILDIDGDIAKIARILNESGEHDESFLTLVDACFARETESAKSKLRDGSEQAKANVAMILTKALL